MNISYQAKFNQPITINIENANQYFYKYISRQHPWLIASPQAAVDADINIVWSKQPFVSETHLFSQGFNKLGQNLYFRRDAFVYLHQDFMQYQLSVDSSLKFNIKVYLNSKSSSLLEATLRKLLKRNSIATINLERLLYLTRFIIHFPVFSKLTRQYDCNVLHAATVAKDDKAILLLGYDGVGKSTLAQHLLQHGYELLADNFTVCDQTKVYPLLEASRLHRDSLQSLNIKINSTQRVFDRFNVLPASLTTEPKDIAAILFNSLGDSNKLESIEPAQMLKYIKSMQHYLPEFIDFNLFKSMLNLILEQDDPALINCQTLLENKPILNLQKGNLTSITETINQVIACI